MTSQVEPTTLKLTKGSTKPFDIVFYDDNDVLAVLAGASAGTFIIKKSVNGANILVRTTTGGTPTLTLDIPNAKLIGALSQIEADALPVGTFIGMASVQFGSKWEDSDPFIVEIAPGFASHA